MFLYANKDKYFSQTSIFGENETSSSSVLSDRDLITVFRKTVMSYDDGTGSDKTKVKQKLAKSRKDLIMVYCDFFLKWPWANWFQKWAYHYESKKSLFMYELCSHVDNSYAEKFNDIKKYIKSSYELKQKDMISSVIWDSSCKWDTDMNGCDLSLLLSGLFKDIINEYSNIKIASMFWYSKWDIQEDVKNFSKLYFGENACGTTSYDYLNKEEIKDPNNMHCSHPKTYKLLNDYITNIKNKLDKSQLLDVDSITDWYFYTSLLERNQQDFAWFKKVLYNELMFYDIFMVYYTYALWVNMSLYPMEIWADSSGINEKKDIEISLAKREAVLSQNAIYATERLLANLYTAFPLHIWLMAYYEDLVNFRDKFKTIYTPFHQMYYKMQNVQDMRK